MKFNNSEKPMKEFGMLKAGIYKFKVLDASDQISKTGNDMIKLKLKFENERVQTHVADFLVAPFPKKIGSFCATTNLMDKFEHGDLEPLDCIEKEGYAELEINEYSFKKLNVETNEMETIEGKNNKVKFYCAKPKNIKEATKVTEEKVEFDDDLPF